MCPTANLSRLNELGVAADIELVDLELVELSNVLRTIERAPVDEIYNLAGPELRRPLVRAAIYTGEPTRSASSAILEAIQALILKFIFIRLRTSEMFGQVVESPQSELRRSIRAAPTRSPRLYAHWIT